MKARVEKFKKSFNDINQNEERGGTKIKLWVNLQGIIGVNREGPKCLKNGVKLFMDDPLQSFSVSDFSF